MSYTKHYPETDSAAKYTEFINNETKLTAEHMTAIRDAIQEDESYLSELDTMVNSHFPATGKFVAGTMNTVTADHATAIGYVTTASGTASFAEGNLTTASGTMSHAEGHSAKASGNQSHAEGDSTKASGNSSHAEGAGSEAAGVASHAEGYGKAMKNYSHAEGYSTTASGDYSHAEGYSATASGDYSHAEGYGTIASGEYSHAEGYYRTTASGRWSHAEGNETVASGDGSHAEGAYTTASGHNSHAEGGETKASGLGSHAEGYETEASEFASHAEGWGTKATQYAQHVFGAYNVEDQNAYPDSYVEIVGNGEENKRSNARTLDWNGNETLAGGLTLGKGTVDETELTAAELAKIKASVKTTLREVMNEQAETRYSGTVTGTRSVSTPLELEAGTYVISVDSVTSSDQDAATCLFIFMNESTEISSSECKFQRGLAQSFTFTTGIDATRFICFASDTYAHAANDTMTFTGLRISKVYPLLATLEDLQDKAAGAAAVVDNALQLCVSGTYSGTRTVSVDHDFPVGDYIVQVDGVTSYDTDDVTSMLLFATSNNVERAQVYLSRRGYPELRFVHLNLAAQKVMLYAGTSYAGSAGDNFTFTNLKIWKVDLDLLRATPITAPAGWRWTDNPVNGHLFRTESGVSCNLDAKAFRPSVGMTYWVSPNGSDDNDGKSATPFHTVGKALSMTDAAVIRLGSGFYDLAMVPGHVNGRTKSIAIVADDNAVPVLTTSQAQVSYTKTSGQTYVYQATVNSNAVWDIAAGQAYQRVATVAEVNATAGSFCVVSGVTYVHTLDGAAPTSANLRCCIAADNLRITAGGAINIYLEGLTLCGGSSGALRVTSNGSVRPKLYAKACKFYGAAEWGAVYLEGAEAVLHNCEAAYSYSDGFGYHANGVSARVVEIGCEGHHNGVDGYTRNGSTMHAAGSVIRVNGSYHHNHGPNVADVQNSTESWNLGCHAWKTTLAEEHGVSQSDFIVSDGTAQMWLDGCSGWGSKYSMVVESPAVAFVRGGIYPTIQASGQLMSY